MDETFMIELRPDGSYFIDEAGKRLLIAALWRAAQDPSGMDGCTSPACREAIRALEGAPAFDLEVRRG